MSQRTPDYTSWIIEGSSGPPLTEGQIADFEQTFALVIPRPYKDFLLCRNGGVVARNTFKMPDHEVFLMYVYGIGCPFAPLDALEHGELSYKSLIRSWNLPADIFPFAQLGHSFCYLKNDATRENSPVFRVLTEIPGQYEYYQLTDTFAEFVNGMYTSPETREMVEMFRDACAALQPDL